MKTYIWSVPTRFFHWLLFIGLVVAYILGDEETNLNLHTALGYMVATLVIFRIFWGFVGPKYSLFKDFPAGFKSLKSFLSDMKGSRDQYIGHNPAASIVMLFILLFILLVACSGMLALASKGHGPLNFLIIGKSEIYKELHEVFVNILIVLVVLHLIGMIADSIMHGNSGTLTSMFTGYKPQSGESIKLNNFQKIFPTLFVALALVTFVLGVTLQNIPKEDKEKEHNKNEMQIKKDDD